jgi:hypothetical protein
MTSIKTICYESQAIASPRYFLKHRSNESACLRCCNISQSNTCEYAVSGVRLKLHLEMRDASPNVPTNGTSAFALAYTWAV